MADRMIRASICTSDKISSLTDFEFRLWIALITQADDLGRGDARPAIIKGSAFPLRDSITAGTIERGLIALENKGCIALYTVEGKNYYHFPSWSEHQRIRDSKPKYPAPVEIRVLPTVGAAEHRAHHSHVENSGACEPHVEELAANCGELRRVAANCGELPLAHSETETETETKKKPNITPSLSPPAGEARATIFKRFERFWEAYPRKKGKGDAEKKFMQIAPSEELFDRIMVSLEEQKQTRQWQEDGGRFIPYPATWLHQRRWEDEPDASVTGGVKQKKGSFDIDEFFNRALEKSYGKSKGE